MYFSAYSSGRMEMNQSKILYQKQNGKIKAGTVFFTHKSLLKMVHLSTHTYLNHTKLFLTADDEIANIRQIFLRMTGADLFSGK